MNMSLATKKKKQKKNILQNYNKMETNKSVYCEGYSIDPIHLCMYILLITTWKKQWIYQ